MLNIDIATIPPEGLEVDEPIGQAEAHLEQEDSFSVLAGGRLKARVEKGDEESVHVRGHLSAKVGMSCGRCLNEFTLPVEQDLDLFFLPHQAEDAGEEEEDEVQLSDRDMVIGYYSGKRLDLGDAVREQLLLAVPMKRVCREECKGLCPRCGTDLNAGTCSCTPDESSGGSRLGSLKDLFPKH